MFGYWNGGSCAIGSDLRHQPLTPQDRPHQLKPEEHPWLTSKGRLKEAAGSLTDESLTDDKSLKDEGKADQAKATVKDKVDKVVDVLSARDKK